MIEDTSARRGQPILAAANNCGSAAGAAGRGAWSEGIMQPQPAKAGKARATLVQTNLVGNWIPLACRALRVRGRAGDGKWREALYRGRRGMLRRRCHSRRSPPLLGAGTAESRLTRVGVCRHRQGGRRRRVRGATRAGDGEARSGASVHVPRPVGRGMQSCQQADQCVAQARLALGCVQCPCRHLTNNAHLARFKEVLLCVLSLFHE
jgi:hypothetical protein